MTGKHAPCRTHPTPVPWCPFCCASGAYAAHRKQAKKPTPLMQARAERDRARAQLSITEIAASLALQYEPNATQTVRDPHEKGSWYRVDAYGLTRHDGGYVVIRFHSPTNTQDSIRFDLFDRWADGEYENAIRFGGIFGKAVDYFRGFRVGLLQRGA